MSITTNNELETKDLKMDIDTIDNMARIFPEICRIMQTNKQIALLNIGNAKICIMISLDGNIKNIIIPIGFDNITNDFFRHIPPTPDELEFAINRIEDEIEKFVHDIDNALILSTTDSFVLKIAHLCKIPQSSCMTLERDLVESLFGQFAASATGRPTGINSPDIEPVFYAQLLIFRELMHHLKFENITYLMFNTSE